VPIIYAQYLYWYFYLKVWYWYWYWYLDHWYWYWYWYLFVEYLIQDCLGEVILRTITKIGRHHLRQEQSAPLAAKSIQFWAVRRPCVCVRYHKVYEHDLLRQTACGNFTRLQLWTAMN